MSLLKPAFCPGFSSSFEELELSSEEPFLQKLREVT